MEFETAILLDIYEKLLTDKQRTAMHFRYDDDLSLAEISELLGISRQAVRDTLCKAEANLKFYEDTLKIAKKESELGKIIKGLAPEQKELAEKLKLLTEE